MQKEAIQLIQETAIASQLARVVDKFNTPIYIGTDNKILDLEQYQELRNRFRGAYNTNSISDFVLHVKKRKEQEQNIHVFLNADNFEAKAIYNYGLLSEPGHCDDTAALSLKKTAAFEALLRVDGVKHDQLSLVNFLEDWNVNIIPLDHDYAEYRLPAAIAAIRKITIKSSGESSHSVTDFGNSSSSLDQIDANSTGLPAGLTFACAPYAGLPEHIFQLRFSVLTGGEKPLCVLRIVQREAELEKIAQAYKALLITEISDAAAVYIGTFAP